MKKNLTWNQWTEGPDKHLFTIISLQQTSCGDDWLIHHLLQRWPNGFLAWVRLLFKVLFQSIKTSTEKHALNTASCWLGLSTENCWLSTEKSSAQWVASSAQKIVISAQKNVVSAQKTARSINLNTAISQLWTASCWQSTTDSCLSLSAANCEIKTGKKTCSQHSKLLAQAQHRKLLAHHSKKSSAQQVAGSAQWNNHLSTENCHLSTENLLNLSIWMQQVCSWELQVAGKAQQTAGCLSTVNCEIMWAQKITLSAQQTIGSGSAQKTAGSAQQKTTQHSKLQAQHRELSSQHRNLSSKHRKTLNQSISAQPSCQSRKASTENTLSAWQTIGSGSEQKTAG